MALTRPPSLAWYRSIYLWLPARHLRKSFLWPEVLMLKGEMILQTKVCSPETVESWDQMLGRHSVTLMRICEMIKDNIYFL